MSVNNKANSYYQKREHIKLAKNAVSKSEITGLTPPPPPSEGIGFMTIGTTFVIPV
jgi:hypothetical protein